MGNKQAKSSEPQRRAFANYLESAVLPRDDYCFAAIKGNRSYIEQMELLSQSNWWDIIQQRVLINMNGGESQEDQESSKSEFIALNPLHLAIATNNIDYLNSFQYLVPYISSPFLQTASDLTSSLEQGTEIMALELALRFQNIDAIKWIIQMTERNWTPDQILKFASQANSEALILLAESKAVLFSSLQISSIEKGLEFLEILHTLTEKTTFMKVLFKSAEKHFQQMDGWLAALYFLFMLRKSDTLYSTSFFMANIYRLDEQLLVENLDLFKQAHDNLSAFGSVPREQRRQLEQQLSGGGIDLRKTRVDQRKADIESGKDVYGDIQTHQMRQPYKLNESEVQIINKINDGLGYELPSDRFLLIHKFLLHNQLTSKIHTRRPNSYTSSTIQQFAPTLQMDAWNSPIPLIEFIFYLYLYVDARTYQHVLQFFLCDLATDAYYQHPEIIEKILIALVKHEAVLYEVLRSFQCQVFFARMGKEWRERVIEEMRKAGVGRLLKVSEIYQ
ncbi:hypothetical protein FGO68_gene3241 [Halteria grandinella]|uniref:Ankyrin repeat protein n=1 Tax=Halteria grandinella TaxID=5974 RepID=A0A8J8T2N6_HALGN|nr:hypothetical protein FGO68_gene3241 [Halteria grandinella]